MTRLRSTREGNTWVEIRLQEGRRNQIRRMFQFLGHSVQKLRRVRVGPIGLDDLEPGLTRELRPPELSALRRACGRKAPPRPLRTYRRSRPGDDRPRARRRTS